MMYYRKEALSDISVIRYLSQPALHSGNSIKQQAQNEKWLFTTMGPIIQWCRDPFTKKSHT